MAALQIQRLNSLPGQLEASTIYITKNANNAALVDMTFTGSDAAEVRRLPGIADTQAAIDAAVNNLTVSQIPNLPGSKITSPVAEATHAVSADSALTAAEATHAASADTATSATTAESADTATKLTTARSINGVAFDGTQNITISAEDTETPRVAVSDLGVTVPTLVDGKIPVSQLPNGLDNIDTFPSKEDFPPVGALDTIYIAEDTNSMYRWSATGEEYILIPSGTSTAETALRLQTPRDIALSGDATGNTLFDGSQNVTIAVTLANVGTAGEQGAVVTTDAKGRVISSRDLTADDIPSLPGSKITSPVAEASHATTADSAESANTAGSAAKLTTARTISVSGPLSGSVSFDGSADVTLELTGEGATGTGTKLTYEGGLVTGSEALLAADIPNLPGSKITSAVAEAVHAQTADALNVTAEW